MVEFRADVRLVASASEFCFFDSPFLHLQWVGTSSGNLVSMAPSSTYVSFFLPINFYQIFIVGAHGH